MDFEDLHPEVLVGRMCTPTPNVSDRDVGNSSSSNQIDYTTDFKTNQVWPDRDSLLVWAREAGRRKNMVLTIGKSWKSTESRYGKVLLTCERYGNYRSGKRGRCREEKEEEGEKKKSRLTKSKKTGCQFCLHGREVQRNEWRLEVDCGIHNHDLPPSLEGHAFAGRLTEEELLAVKELSESGSKPKVILSKLKLESTTNVTSRQQIYNAIQKLKKESKKDERLVALEGLPDRCVVESSQSSSLV